jgi:hypothetical protein
MCVLASSVGVLFALSWPYQRGVLRLIVTTSKIEAPSKLDKRLQQVALALSVTSSVITILAFTTGISRLGVPISELVKSIHNWSGKLPTVVAWPVWAIGWFLWGCLILAYRLALILGLPAVPALLVNYLGALYTRLWTGRTTDSFGGPQFLALLLYIVSLFALIIVLDLNPTLGRRLGLG